MHRANSKTSGSNINAMDIIGAVRDGSSKSFAMLCEQYKPLILKMASVYSGDGIELDDLNQILLISLYNAACSYSPEVGITFGTYAKICMRHAVATEFGRREVSTIQLDDEDSESLTVSAEEEVVLLCSYDDMLTSIKKVLSANEYSCFFMKLEGASYAEISAELGLSEKTISVLLSRARKKLRTLFANKPDKD